MQGFKVSQVASNGKDRSKGKIKSPTLPKAGKYGPPASGCDNIKCAAQLFCELQNIPGWSQGGPAMKLSDYVMEFVADLGVKHVFVVTGGGAMHLNDSLARCERLEFICNHHEQACAIAAENYAKATNGLGVAMVTTGPGGTNADHRIGGSVARFDSVPVSLRAGEARRPDVYRRRNASGSAAARTAGARYHLRGEAADQICRNGDRSGFDPLPPGESSSSGD